MTLWPWHWLCHKKARHIILRSLQSLRTRTGSEQKRAEDTKDSTPRHFSKTLLGMCSKYPRNLGAFVKDLLLWNHFKFIWHDCDDRLASSHKKSLHFPKPVHLSSLSSLSSKLPRLRAGSSCACEEKEACNPWPAVHSVELSCTPPFKNIKLQLSQANLPNNHPEECCTTHCRAHVAWVAYGGPTKNNLLELMQKLQTLMFAALSMNRICSATMHSPAKARSLNWLKWQIADRLG